MENGNPIPEEKLQKQQQASRAAISCAIEVKMAFELYSFRILQPGDFVDRMNDLAKTLIDATPKDAFTNE